MSEFAVQLLDRIQTRVWQLLRGTAPKPSFALPRLREFPHTQSLPWDPCPPMLTIEELHLLRGLRQELNHELAEEEVISDREVLHFALQELQAKFRSSARTDILSRLAFHLWNVRRKKSVD
jgi:hypothetical protein